MSNPHLPAEMLDHIVDFLHDTKHTLENFCLTSKSWIPRTRTHLFSGIGFYTGAELESWKEMFPDLLTSPARYAKTLIVGCSHVVTAADGEVGGWIRGFSRVVHLEVSGESTYANESAIPLLPFHGLSPIVKSLCVNFIALLSSQVFDLIFSFPLLEDLTVIGFDTSTDNGDGPDGFPITVQPSTSPTLTGSLELFMRGGAKTLTRRLLSLPGGIHFRKLILTWNREQDLSTTMTLVCSSTLESLNVTCDPFGTSFQHSCRR